MPTPSEMGLPNIGSQTADTLYNWLVKQTAEVLSPGSTGQAGSAGEVFTNPGGGTPPGTTPPGAPPSSGDSGVDWSSMINFNPQYPYAILGGKDNFDAKKPPEWMVKMIDDALAMPDGPEKTARLMHISATTTGMPQYLLDYITQRVNPALGG